MTPPLHARLVVGASAPVVRRALGPVAWVCLETIATDARPVGHLHDWEGPASLALRRADPGVVGTYEHHGRVRVGTFDEHADQITGQWLEHTRHGRTVAVTAATNEEVDRLNTAIQTARVELGQLDPTVGVAGGGGDRLHPGDVVATRQNRRDLTTDRGVMVKNRAQWTVTHTHPDGQVTVTGADGAITLPGDYTRGHVRLAYAATVYGTQGATVHRSITLVSGATDHRNLYVGATRGRDVNELYVLADTMEDARDTLETALARDRVDTPAVAVRRELLGQTSGVGITTQEDWTTTTRTPRGGEGSPRPVAGRIPEEPALDPSDPFAGLETVHHALQRLLTEQAARQAPRHGYRVLEGDLARLQGERERLEHGPRPYEHGPLDRVHTVRHNAGVEVSQLTSRLEHAPWRDRRRIRRLLADATQRLEQAEAAYQTAYQREIGRLEPLIEAARVRLEHAPRPEPIGPREQELERGIGWLHWEDGVGNGERPTLEALHERRDQLDQAATRQRPLTPGEQAVYRAIVGELDDRGMQYQTAVEAQQQSVLARQQALRTAHPGGYRGLGCQL